MKQCSVCGKVKSKQDFFFRDKNTGKRHSQCKQCYTDKRKGTYKQHYHKHGSEYRVRAIQRNRKIKDYLRRKMLDYLTDKSCIQCGINDRRVLDFDHLDPTLKSFSIARGITNTRSWDAILLEIKKCQILCANCHRIRTSEQQNWYRT